MKITEKNIKDLISVLGFLPEEGKDNIYYKKYNNFNNYIIRINFNTEKIEYRQDNISEENGIRWGDNTTSNFANSENFVVLECIDRLLEKGYPPQNLYLEYKFPLGRNEKGKLDILVFDNEQKAYLMIECKTWGAEFTKEQKKMQKDGGQLFSYFVQDKATQYLCLYTSHLQNDTVEYSNDIIKVQEEWSELNNQKEIHEHWNKNVSDNGIFEQWANTYDIEIKALVRGRLQPLTKDDSGRIFNQFAEILRHNVVSDKPNAFNKMLNLFICKIIDEDKNDDEQVEFQWLDDDTNESLQLRLNDLYKKGMHRFLNIDVTDFSENDISDTLDNIGDSQAKQTLRDIIIKLRLQKNPEFAFIEVYDETSFKLNARVVKEVVELLQPYQFRYGHKQQFLGDFFELLLNTSIKQEAGQFFTPVPIARYIIYSLPIKEVIEKKIETDEAEILPTVIDFACGTGHFLTEYMDRVQHIIENDIDSNKAKRTAKKKLSYWSGEDGKFEWASEFVYGIDADYRLVKSTKVSSFLNGDGEANIIRANGLDSFSESKEYRGKLKLSTDSKDNGQFDILIANPPYAVNSFKSTIKNGEKSFELFSKLTDNSSEIECLFVERMKQLLKVGGCAGIVLPSSILNNSGIYTATREIILKYFKIIAITELGSNTFMATGTNTIIMFLERRANNDHIHIQTAINKFFENGKDVTVLGIEKAFSKYVTFVFEDITFDDYISFVNRKPSSAFCNLEIYNDYKAWFEDLTEIKNLKKSKSFTELSSDEQHHKLKKMFFDKVHEIEKDKILYFLLTYSQKTVITKVGEKQAEKEFLGYEFSNRRGHEGIKMLPSGTRLYDEGFPLNPKKANSYIYNAFLKKDLFVNEYLENNIFSLDSVQLMDFSASLFDKKIEIGTRKQAPIMSNWNSEKLKNLVYAKGGDSFPKEYQGNTNTENIPFLKVSDMNEAINGKYVLNTNNYVDKDTIDVIKSTVFNKNSIIFPKVGMAIFTEKKRILSRDMCIDNNVMALSIINNDVLHYEFLYELFDKYIKLKNFSSTANPPSIQTDKLMEYKIPVPPMEIQRKIVDELTDIDVFEKNSCDKIIRIKEKMDNIIQNLEYTTTKKIKEISIINPAKPNVKDYDSDMLVSFVAMASVNKNGFIQNSEKRKIVDVASGGYTSFCNDDIIIAKITPCMENGKCALVTGMLNDIGYGSTEFHVIRVNKELILPKYLFLLINREEVREMAKKQMTGASGHRRVPQSFYEEYNIPFIDIDSQKKIVNQIELLEKEMQSIELEMQSIEEQKKTVLEKYL